MLQTLYVVVLKVVNWKKESQRGDHLFIPLQLPGLVPNALCIRLPFPCVGYVLTA